MALTLLHQIEAVLLVIMMVSSALYLLISVSGRRVDKNVSRAERKRFLRIGTINREDAKKFIREDFVGPLMLFRWLSICAFIVVVVLVLTEHAVRAFLS